MEKRIASVKRIDWELRNRLRNAVQEHCPNLSSSEILIRKCNPKWGDYQCASLIALIKRQGGNPRSVAAAVVESFVKMDRAAENPLCESVEVAGAGFINFRLKVAALENWLNEKVPSGIEVHLS